MPTAGCSVGIHATDAQAARAPSCCRHVSTFWLNRHTSSQRTKVMGIYMVMLLAAGSDASRTTHTHTFAACPKTSSAIKAQKLASCVGDAIAPQMPLRASRSKQHAMQRRGKYKRGTTHGSYRDSKHGGVAMPGMLLQRPSSARPLQLTFRGLPSTRYHHPGHTLSPGKEWTRRWWRRSRGRGQPAGTSQKGQAGSGRG